jgi:hypothetical protein
MRNKNSKVVEIVLNANSNPRSCEESSLSLSSTERDKKERDTGDYVILTRNMPFTIKAY